MNMDFFLSNFIIFSPIFVTSRPNIPAKRQTSKPARLSASQLSISPLSAVLTRRDRDRGRRRARAAQVARRTHRRGGRLRRAAFPRAADGGGRRAGSRAASRRLGDADIRADGRAAYDARRGGTGGCAVGGGAAECTVGWREEAEEGVSRCGGMAGEGG